METELQPGDKVYHKANTRIYWIIEKIENGEAFCSTLNDQLEKITATFSLISIEKYVYKPPIIISPGKTNRY